MLLAPFVRVLLKTIWWNWILHWWDLSAWKQLRDSLYKKPLLPECKENKTLTRKDFLCGIGPMEIIILQLLQFILITFDWIVGKRAWEVLSYATTSCLGKHICAPDQPNFCSLDFFWPLCACGNYHPVHSVESKTRLFKLIALLGSSYSKTVKTNMQWDREKSYFSDDHV